MKSITYYIDVILPLPVQGSFTYSLKEDVSVGQRVVVQFGSRKLYTAIVVKTNVVQPEEYVVKEVLAVMDESPIVNNLQLEFWYWLADYYMCTVGDVMNAALPSSLKLASESKIIISTDFDGDLEGLNQQEIIVVNTLGTQEELYVKSLSKIVNVTNVLGFVNELIRKDVVQMQEDLHEKFKEKKIRVLLFIATEYQLGSINITSKQQAFIDVFHSLELKYPKKKWIVSDVLRRSGSSRSVLNTLVKKNIFRVDEQVISRLMLEESKEYFSVDLVDFQQKAIDQIRDSFKERDVCLLHGVTSSGKTEIYIKLIEEQLNEGKQVLYLLPEIALTTQIIKRLRKCFGDQIGVSHSYLNNSERVEIWNSVKVDQSKEKYMPVILGARSSLFLPYHNLGLVIVDEEHDTSFKQNQPAPRYNARDAAIYLAGIHKAKVLLGSATPSAESYYNARIKKYSLVEIHTRFANMLLPKLKTIDIRKSHLKKKMVHQFDPKMISEIKEILDNGKQVILFQNQRGYSPFLSCQHCAFTPHCTQCDVSLTYHKIRDHIRCHYCGYTENVPVICPSCSFTDFHDKGFGTEQITESVQDLFPEAITKRMDYDTTRRKNAYESIINDFEQGKIDILVGTQMVAKGLDFDNVGLVGIINADAMLRFPDFRSYERGFSLMMQVAGRAGRKGDQGKVLIQTYDDKNEIFPLLENHDYNTFINKQIKERKLFNYPPYSRLIAIILKHKDKDCLDRCSAQLSSHMRKSFGERVLGPEYPFISRIRNYYHKNILLKIEHDSSVNSAKKILNSIIASLNKQQDFRSVRIIIDVDPM